MTSCACTGPDAEAAFDAIRAGPTVLRLIDESHLIVRLVRCRCGRGYLSVFTELIDWAGGDDPQRRVYTPLDEQELLHLLALAAKGEVDEQDLLNAAGAWPARRLLERDWPSGAATHDFRWRTGAVAIAPHD